MQAQKTKPMAGKHKIGIYFGIAIAAIVIVIATAVYPASNLFSNKVTETVKIVSVNEDGYGGCIAQTPDNYYVKLPSCDGKPGDSILATYDAKIKQKTDVFQP